MDYSKFEVEDFLSDEAFLDWVLKPTPEQDLFWHNWVGQNPHRREVLEEAKRLLLSIDFTEKWSGAERKQMWENIETNILNEDSTKRSRKFFPAWSYMAAASVALILGTWFYWLGTPQKISTDFGEIRSLTLSDGTKITLNANSELTLSRSFLEDSIRQVWIKGEAFFEVASRKVASRKVPFVVNTSQLKVEVLGTAFNILNRRGRVDVALEHGSVKLVDAVDEKNTMMLEPGEKATQLTGHATIRKEDVDITEYKGWTENVVRYRSKSLKELSEMVQDAYGIEIVIENDALAEEMFTGTFPADSVTVFFDKLQKLYPIEVSKQGRRYYLK